MQKKIFQIYKHFSVNELNKQNQLLKKVLSSYKYICENCVIFKKIM